MGVAELIGRYIFRQHHSTFPLVQDGRIAGLVSLRLQGLLVGVVTPTDLVRGTRRTGGAAW